VLTCDESSSRDRDPRLRQVVWSLQEALDQAGCRAALLHESPGAMDEHDIDLAVEGSFRDVWPAILSATTRHAYRPLLIAEYDVGDSWYAVFARAEGGDVSRVAVDTCGDARGIGKYGVPMSRLLDWAVVRSGLQCADPAWGSTYVLAKHVWKRIPSSASLDATAARVRWGPDAFQEAALHVFGRRLATRVVERVRAGGPLTTDVELPVLLRSIRVRRILRSPLLPLRFILRWLSRWMHPNGAWIVIAGPDGTGKTTIVSQLHTCLAPLFRRSLLLHWSPGALPRPGSLLGQVTRDPSHPHDAEPHGTIISTLLLIYHWVDHAVGYFTRIRPALVRSGLVLMERGYHDLAVDPRRYRLAVSPRLVRALGRFLPRPDLTILLHGDATVLHERKSELERTEIDRQQRAWRAQRGDLGNVAMVDVTNERAGVFGDVLDAVLSARSTAIIDSLRLEER
jgi:thymidylate kinase